MKQPDPIETGIRRLYARRYFWHGDRKIIVACLIRRADWTLLEAPWWRGKAAYVMGADLDGNFFLQHCDGTVRFWEHRLQVDTVIARSGKDFVAKIVA